MFYNVFQKYVSNLEIPETYMEKIFRLKANSAKQALEYVINISPYTYGMLEFKQYGKSCIAKNDYVYFVAIPYYPQ